MKPLEGTIAVVAGASRAAGRGIALVLGEAGATVYAAARTSKDLHETAALVASRDGKCVVVIADLSNERQVELLFDRVLKEHGRMDLLANSAWVADFLSEGSKPFWALTPRLFRDTLAAVSVCWWASVYAARAMQQQGSGLRARDRQSA